LPHADLVGPDAGREHGRNDPHRDRPDHHELRESDDAAHLPPPTFSSWIRLGEPSCWYGWMSIVTPLSRSPSRSITRSTGWLRNASICALFDRYSASSCALSSSAFAFDAECEASPAPVF